MAKFASPECASKLNVIAHHTPPHDYTSGFPPASKNMMSIPFWMDAYNSYIICFYMFEMPKGSKRPSWPK